MARTVLVDAGFLVALLSRRDSHHPWAVSKRLATLHLGALAKPFCLRPSTFSAHAGRQDSADFFAAEPYSLLSS
jgi:hypothetical protein